MRLQVSNVAKFVLSLLGRHRLGLAVENPRQVTFLHLRMNKFYLKFLSLDIQCISVGDRRRRHLLLQHKNKKTKQIKIKKTVLRSKLCEILCFVSNYVYLKYFPVDPSGFYVDRYRINLFNLLENHCVSFLFVFGGFFIFKPS